MTAEHPLTVGERMSADPIVVRADAPLSEAARLLEEHRITGLPVVDDDGRLVGVLSQVDLAHARATEYLWRRWPGLAVRHLMTSPPVTVKASTPLLTAARKMERRRIHRLVVVDDHDPVRPVGVLSLTDVVHLIADETAASPSASVPEAVDV